MPNPENASARQIYGESFAFRRARTPLAGARTGPVLTSFFAAAWRRRRAGALSTRSRAARSKRRAEGIST